MAWSWSHTAEAYLNARKNLFSLSPDKLCVIYAEWQAHEGDNDLNERAYETALSEAHDLPIDVLIDYIWEKMETQSLCENGGHEAWCCPFGCGCHMVPFDRPSGSSL